MNVEAIVGLDRPVDVLCAGGAFGLRSAYLSDSLHRGSIVWTRLIAPMQREWSAYLGYDNFDSMPIAQRSLVRLRIADTLLTSFYVPKNGEATTQVKEVRAAMNSLRILTQQLSDMKKEKRVPSLVEYLAEKVSGND